MLESLRFNTTDSAAAWAEANLEFTPEVSPNHPGALSLARQPWMREIVDAFLDSSLEHLHLVMGSQTGKTTACLLGAAALQTFDPLPIIWAMPSGDIVRRFVNARFLPLWRANGVLGGQMGEDPLHFGLLKTGLTEFFFLGVREPGNVASQPAGYVIMDEEAKFEHVRKHEAHPSLLLESRVKSFSRHLIVHASTPNTEEHPFWQSYLASDQRKFFHPCPACGQEFTMEFSRETLQWEHPVSGVTEDVVRDTAHYICPSCHCKITDADKLAMLARGRWRSTNPHAPAWRRGYHLSSLYSPDLSFGEFAVEFWRATQAQSLPDAYQNFVNSWCALPYVPYTVKVGDEHVRNLIGALSKGTLPQEYYFVCVAYDPGQVNTHWAACAIGRGGEMWVVDYGTILSFSTDEDSGRLGIAAHFQSLNWGGIRPDFGFADSGDWTEAIYSECDRTGGIVSPTKGGHAAGVWGQVQLKTHPLLDLHTYNDNAIKSELYGRMIALGEVAALHLPADVTPDFIAGLSGQTRVRKAGGAAVWKPLPNDHYGDCVKLCRLAWWKYRADIEPPEPVKTDQK